MSKPILCVDFDGVVHSYSSGWKGVDVIPDPPVPGALRWLLDAVEHFEVHIYSSRTKQEGGRSAMMRWFAAESVNGMSAGDALALNDALVFSHDKPAAFLTIDDRAICFDGDWSALDPVELLKFKPWNKR